MVRAFLVAAFGLVSITLNGCGTATGGPTPPPTPAPEPTPAPPSFEVVVEFVTPEFEWPSKAEEEAAKQSKEYIPENNAMAGIKICGPHVASVCAETMVFVTVPRWRTGVPATLNLLTNKSVLRPWPSKESQSTSSCDNIQYVQSMEIDPKGVMWVLDVGRKYFATKGAVDNSCPPKLVLLQLPAGNKLETYVFPDDVAPHTGAFLNDLVIDVKNEFAYISSTGNNKSDLGGIIVYDRKNKRSRRFEDESTHHENPEPALIIHKTNYTADLSVFPVDGIALAPGRDRLYYCPLGGYHVYSLDTAKLMDFNTTTDDIKTTEVDHGQKPSNSDGMTFGSNGELFFGGLTTDSLYRWTPGSSFNESTTVARNSTDLQWIDTFAFDGEGNIWVTTNKLNLYFFGGMDYSGKSGPNYRVIKIPVGTNSYMAPSSGLREQVVDVV